MSHAVDIDEWFLDREKRVRLRVRIVEFDGRWRIDIRPWSASDDGLEQPSRKGLALAIRHLCRLKNAIAKAYVGAVARDLIDAIPEPESD